MAPPAVVVLEGNIGAGKSTLLLELGERCADLVAAGALTLVPEPVEEWCADAEKEGPSALAAYLEDPARHSAAFQVEVIASKARHYRRVVGVAAGARHPAVVVVERGFDCEVFLRLLELEGVLSWLEARALRSLQALLAESGAVPRPDLTVYLRVPPETCVERTRLRAREGESAASMDARIHRLHDLHDRLFGDAPGHAVLRGGEGARASDLAAELEARVRELCAQR